ncbi:hypothetical protein LINPERHAP1_LOCUS36861 [Linum perenne]
MGLRNPRTQQEDPNLARNLPHRRDGGACTRRRRLSSPWQVGLLKLRRLGLAAKSSRFRRYERDPEGRRRSGGGVPAAAAGGDARGGGGWCWGDGYSVESYDDDAEGDFGDVSLWSYPF